MGIGSLPEQDACEIAMAWAHSHGAVKMFLPALHRFVPELSRVCESISTTSAGMWSLFQWDVVIDTLFKALASRRPLPDGHVVIDVADFGCIALTVTSGSALCIKSDDAL